MGVHFNNVFALARAIHQIVMHRHIDFTDHLKRCRKQQIGRTRHDALGTVFHRNNRKVSGAAGGLMKHFVETFAGKRLETRAELPNHGFLGERSLRPEKGHARQSLDGTARGHNFAYDVANRLFTQKRTFSFSACHGSFENFTLALGLIDGSGRFEFANRTRQLGALFQKSEKLGIRCINHLAQLFDAAAARAEIRHFMFPLFSFCF